MRRTSMKWNRVALSSVLAVMGMLAAALPAMATLASFEGSWGFDPAGLGDLPTGQYSGDLLDAGAPGTSSNLAVELSNSTDLCILASGSSTCQATTAGIDGAYSVLVTVGVTVLDQDIDGPFTLMLTSVAGGSGYTSSEVQVELNPTAPAGLNSVAVPGFSFGGSFDPFVRVEDVTFLASSGVTYDYIGWTVTDGDSVSFRYEVLTAPDGRATPQLTANAIIAVVPEPGTALLMGLGLAGLATGGRRLRSA